MGKNTVTVEAYGNTWLDVIPVDAEVIDQTLHRLKLTVPDELRNMFIQCNGGYPRTSTYFGKYEVSLGNLLPFGIKGTWKRRSFDEIYTKLVLEEKVIPKELVPFGWDTGNANLLCTKSDTDEVVYWVHDDQENSVKIVAPSIADFLENLEEL